MTREDKEWLVRLSQILVDGLDSSIRNKGMASSTLLLILTRLEELKTK